MLKKVPCSDCNGRGFICQTTEYSITSKICSVCNGLGYIEVPMTNADRIRAMSDEELQIFLCNNTECGSCQWCEPQGCTLDEWLEGEC